MESRADEQNQRTSRILSVGLLLLIMLLTLIGRFFYWHFLRDENDIIEAIDSREIVAQIPARRGEIRDASGHPLAIEVLRYHVTCRPKDIKHENWLTTAEKLAPVVGQTRETILNRLEEGYKRATGPDPNTAQNYARLAFYVTSAQSEAVTKLGLDKVYVEPARLRLYPEGTLAAHILGCVNAETVGVAGLENAYDEELSGQEGRQRVIDDGRGSTSFELSEPQDGADLVLTINRALQYETEKALRQVITEQRAERGTIVVVEPKTGAILAMASYPTFDPNRYIGIDEKLFRNPAVNEQYEPGSVMKVVTLASGLDLGVVTSRWSYNDTGIFYVGGIPITNHDGSAHGPSTLTDILAHSLNTGAATISKLMFADPFHRYMSNFGFGKASGVDLPAEAPGLLHSPNSADWCEADLGTNSFGQGVSVTPLQMVNAIAAIANGGKLMRPYVVQEIHHDDQVSKTEPKEIRRVVSEQVAREMTNMLVAATEAACPQATVPGYHVAGKTGTAQVPVNGVYDPDPSQVVASYVGYAPAENPRFVMLITITRPKVEMWGGTVAAPVFQTLAGRFLTLLNVPPDPALLKKTATTP